MTKKMTHEPETTDKHPYKNWWNLEQQKSKTQAIFSYAAFVVIVSLIDIIIPLLFSWPEKSEIYFFLKKYDPSILICFVLCVMLIKDRVIPKEWIKGICGLGAIYGAWIGDMFITSAFFGLMPMIYLLQQPVKDKNKKGDTS